MPDFNNTDIVKFAASGDKVSFMKAVRQNLESMASDAIEARKQEVALNLFKGDDDAEEV